MNKLAPPASPPRPATNDDVLRAVTALHEANAKMHEAQARSYTVLHDHVTSLSTRTARAEERIDKLSRTTLSDIAEAKRQTSQVDLREQADIAKATVRAQRAEKAIADVEVYLAHAHRRLTRPWWRGIINAQTLTSFLAALIAAYLAAKGVSK